MGTLVKLILLFLIVFVIYKVVGYVRRFSQMLRPYRTDLEDCPACEQKVRVPSEPDRCPQCGVKLGRNKQGKLLIRI